MPISYPIHLNLSNRLCVVVGGGAVAERKVLGLLEAGGRVRVVSPALSPNLLKLGVSGEIETIVSAYRSSYIQEAFLVFAATNLPEVNAQIVLDAKALNLLANSADTPDAGNFVTPSVVRRGELCLSVTTGGGSPTLSSRISAELSERFGEEYGAYIELLGRFRVSIKAKIKDPPLRKAALVAILTRESELLALLKEDKTEEADRMAEAVLNQF